MSRGRAHARRRGQSIVEFALAAPVLAILLFGTYAVGVFAADRVAGEQAVRGGARLASELGGLPAEDAVIHDDFDRQIVSQVVVGATAMNYVTLTEIAIYPACTPFPGCGSDAAHPQHASGDPIDLRKPDGTPMGAQSFTLNLRAQTPPSETPIGVSLTYTYTPPVTVGYFQVVVHEYEVMRVAPNFG